MYKFLQTLCLLLFLAGSQAVIAQENSLKEDKVPEAVKTYLKASYPNSGSLKYYQETEDDSSFIVAEFKSEGKEYALGFLPNGKLHEVEVETEFQQLPPESRNQIENYLKQQFRKYHIRECEIVNPGASALYELNVKGYTRSSRKFYEMYFDGSGKFLRSHEVLLTPIETLF